MTPSSDFDQILENDDVYTHGTSVEVMLSMLTLFLMTTQSGVLLLSDISSPALQQ